MPESSSFQEVHKAPGIPRQQYNPESSGDIVKAQLIDTIFHGQANTFLRGKITPEYENRLKKFGQTEKVIQQQSSDFTNADLKDFQNMRSMSELRAKATRLLDRYNNDPIREQSAKEAWYARQSQQIWEKAGKLVDRFLKYRNRSIHVEGLNASTEEILEQIRRQVPEAYEMSKEIEKGYRNSQTEVLIKLPVLKGKEDSESIKLRFDEAGDIALVEFHELYDYRHPFNLDELAASYNQGQQLSPSQMQLLKDNGLITHSVDTAADGEKALKFSEKPVNLSLLILLGYALPEDLRKKVKGLWAEDGDFKQGFDETWIDTGEIVLTNHAHDHNPNFELNATLKAKSLSQEDIYRILGIYIDVLKAFPRVDKA